VIGAAVDVGSNSVHLLVARVDDDGLEPIADESELIGLGDVVDAEGVIPAASVDVLVRALLQYRDRARSLGATTVTFVATEPLRRARNATEVATEVEQQTGVALQILTGSEEGELTFLGVTGGRRVDEPMLVVDIGGGSTEVVLFDPTTGVTPTGLPTGSARLQNEFVEHDPPTAEEVVRLRTAAADAVAGLPAAKPAKAVFVGGTATNLVRFGPLAIGSFDSVFEALCGAPAAEIAQRYAVRLRRAQQLAAGAALAEALLRHYGLAEGQVSDQSLRDGAILEQMGRTG
jgi:exopolyphosphatase/pppGpp-phosphohydrolase